MGYINEMKMNELIKLNSLKKLDELEKIKKELIEKNRLKKILSQLGYLDVYLNIYLKNTNKKDNLKNIQQYINKNLDSWLRDGHRL